MEGGQEEAGRREDGGGRLPAGGGQVPQLPRTVMLLLTLVLCAPRPAWLCEFSCPTWGCKFCEGLWLLLEKAVCRVLGLSARQCLAQGSWGNFVA